MEVVVCANRLHVELTRRGCCYFADSYESHPRATSRRTHGESVDSVTRCRAEIDVVDPPLDRGGPVVPPKESETPCQIQVASHGPLRGARRSWRIGGPTAVESRRERSGQSPLHCHATAIGSNQARGDPSSAILPRHSGRSRGWRSLGRRSNRRCRAPHGASAAIAPRPSEDRGPEGFIRRPRLVGRASQLRPSPEGHEPTPLSGHTRPHCTVVHAITMEARPPFSRPGLSKCAAAPRPLG